MKGSTQLRQFLTLIRTGTPTEHAAQQSDIGIGEALLHAQADRDGEYADISTMEKIMSDDNVFAELAVGLSEDHKAEKKKRGRPPKADNTPGPDPVGEEADMTDESTISDSQETAVSDPVEASADTASDDLSDRTHRGHEANLDHLSDIADAYIADQSALLGSFRDVVLELFRNRRSPWVAMPPAEQRDIVTAIDYAGRKIIQEMVIAVAAKNRPSIPAHFKKLGSDGAKMTLTMEVNVATTSREDENALHDSLRQDVIIVPADWSAYDRVKREAVEAEEPELAFADAEETAVEKRKREYGIADTDPNPDHPGDDTDLAGDGASDAGFGGVEEDDEIVEDEPAATHVVYDPVEQVWLTAETDAWTDDKNVAGRWDEGRAVELAIEHEATAEIT